MDMSSVLSSISIPTVITKELLIDSVIKQGPQDQAGKFFQEDGIKLEEITEIRLEHCNILHICNLWVMQNLTKLSLCNNIIEKIENLNELVNLTELDLSFNHIKVIENLDTLVNMEILSLYSNKIKELTGLDNLTKLQIFSIGKNLLCNRDHVLYLRKFKSLRSLNTSENPCAEEEGYSEYVIAFIPQLIYLTYKMINEKDRNSAIEKHDREIAQLEDQESSEREKLESKKLFEEHLNILHKACVEYLDEDYLFNELYKSDKEGQQFIEISQDIENAHESYKQIFCDICHELVSFGLSEQERRSKELTLFNKTIEDEKSKVTETARKITDRILENKSAYFLEILELLDKITDQDDPKLNELFEKVETSTLKVISFVTNEWHDLMKNEVTLHQQLLDTFEIFKANMTDMVNHFVETSRGYFIQLRSAEVEYNSNLNKLALIFLSNFGDDVKIPEHLIDLCGDKDTLNNNISATHDVHLQVIDTREDILINSIKTWFSELMENLTEKETRRYKSRILEITRVLEFQNQELENMQKHDRSAVKDVIQKIKSLFDENELMNLVWHNNK